MVIITICVPDNTTRLLYTQLDESGVYETEPKTVTLGMIDKVEAVEAKVPPLIVNCDYAEIPNISREDETGEAPMR